MTPRTEMHTAVGSLLSEVGYVIDTLRLASLSADAGGDIDPALIAATVRLAVNRLEALIEPVKTMHDATRSGAH